AGDTNGVGRPNPCGVSQEPRQLRVPTSIRRPKMNAPAEAAVIKQHLIDPEICIRCNTCESICPVGAITHDSRNYVVDVNKCNWCNDCISPCPTGSIDNYRRVVKAKAYSLEEQLGWDELPP